MKTFVPICPLPLPEVTPVIVQVIVEPEQLSPKVIEGIATVATHVFMSLPTIILSGQVIVGFSVSVIVTLKLHWVVLAGVAPSVTT